MALIVSDPSQHVGALGPEAIDRSLGTPFTLLHFKTSGEIRQALVHINEPTDSDILVLGAKELITSPQVFLTN